MYVTNTGMWMRTLEANQKMDMNNSCVSLLTQNILWSWQVYHMQWERCTIQLGRGLLKKGYKFYLQKISSHVPSYILCFSLQRSRACFLHHFNKVSVELNSSWVSVSTLTLPEGWIPADLSQAAQILFSSQRANVQLKRWNFGSAVRVTSELKPWKKSFFYFLLLFTGCSSLLVKAKEQIQKTSSHADNEQFYSVTKVI